MVPVHGNVTLGEVTEEDLAIDHVGSEVEQAQQQAELAGGGRPALVEHGEDAFDGIESRCVGLHLPRPLRHRRPEGREHIAWQRGVQSPGDLHGPVAPVLDVRGQAGAEVGQRPAGRIPLG